MRGLFSDFRGGPSLVGSLLRGTFIQSIQRGTVSCGNASATGTASITAVVMGNSMLIPGHFRVATVTTNSPQGVIPRIELTNTTTVTGTVDTTGTGLDSTQPFQVVEFVPGILRSVQRGTITIGSGNTSGTATITAVVTGKAFVNYLGMTTTDNTAWGTIDPGVVLASLVLTNTTTVTAQKNSSHLFTDTVSYEVIEFW